jgi:hypothetical protein
LIKKDYSETIADLQKNLSISRYQKEVMVLKLAVLMNKYKTRKRTLPSYRAVPMLKAVILYKIDQNLGVKL